jgi:hypothetical protein
VEGLTRHPGNHPSVPFSHPSPYDRKPSPFGATMSISAKGVSRGVHNIAFSLLRDHFRALDLVFFFGFFHLEVPGRAWRVATGVKAMQEGDGAPLRTGRTPMCWTIGKQWSHLAGFGRVAHLVHETIGAMGPTRDFGHEGNHKLPPCVSIMRRRPIMVKSRVRSHLSHSREVVQSNSDLVHQTMA